MNDPRLEDRVADNVGKWEITESESLLFGRNFGLVTDVHTGPDGHLYVVSNDRGAAWVIDRLYFPSIYFREPNGVLFEIADGLAGRRPAGGGWTRW